MGVFFTRKNSGNSCTTVLLSIILLLGILQVGLLFSPSTERPPVVRKSTSFSKNDYSKTLTPTGASAPSLWNRTFGEGYNDQGFSIKECTDGGLIVTGLADSAYYPHSGDLVLIRTDATGNFLWTQNYGGTGFQVGRSMIAVSDGGYVIAGSTGIRLNNPDVWVLRVDDL